MPLISEEQVVLDLTGADRHEATRALAERLAATGRCTDLETFLHDVRERESKMATGLPGGIGIPHARSSAITEPSLVFGRVADGIDWGAKDGPARLVFLIAAPADGGDAHMQVLPQLARALMREDFRAALLDAQSPAEVVAVVGEHVQLAEAKPAADPEPAAAKPAAAEPESAAEEEAPAAEKEAPAAPAVPATGLKLVGVTSCPTGIAHTYMAAEALENAAKAAGHTMLVETQGSAGSTPLTAQQIAEADAVVFAHDLEVKDRGRFAGKPTVDVGVKKAVSDAPELIARAERAAAQWAADPARAAAAEAEAQQDFEGEGESRVGFGTKLRQWLMTGVSYMIPFVAAGGILIALSFMLAQIALGDEGAIEVVKYGLAGDDEYNLMNHFSALNLTSWAGLLFVMGSTTFGFLVPILSGYIAFAIADRPGLVPGIAGGAIAVAMNAGFLGGLLTGLLAGAIARWIAGWNVHKGVRGIMPVVVIPLLSTFITAGLFITLLGRPVVWLMEAMNDGLNSLTGGGVLVLGLILGGMMGFDLGGPVNKVAYGFATAGLSAAAGVTDAPQLKIMAAVMAAGMVAPLALALATAVRPKLFSPIERENGKAAWLLGASFISEGAIPFAAADPIRVLVSSLIGSAVTGGLAMWFGTTLMAPHGGIWVLPLIGQPLLFVVALAAGVLVMAAIVIALKSLAQRRQQEAAAEVGAPASAH